jgi:AraC family transcriptional regulator
MHLSPYEFRKQTDSISTNTQISFEEIDKQIKIEIHPDYKVIYERKISDYKDMKNDWCDFTEKYSKYITSKTIFFERTYDDPTITEKNHCIYDICMTYPENSGLKKHNCINRWKICRISIQRFYKRHFRNSCFVITKYLVSTKWIRTR